MLVRLSSRILSSILFRQSGNFALNLSCKIQLIRNQVNSIHTVTTNYYIMHGQYVCLGIHCARGM
jgi:uncharacterized protein YcsI (UPF0317 family)